MGWLSSRSWATRDDLVAHLVQEYTLVDHAIVAGDLYGLSLYEGQHSVLVFLLSNFGTDTTTTQGRVKYSEWGYKAMSETVYPYCFNCPERILAKSDLPDESGWRAACRRHRTAKYRPKDGDVVEITRDLLPEWAEGCRIFTVTRKVLLGHTRGYYCYTAVDNPRVAYRLTDKVLESLKFKRVSTQVSSCAI